MSNIINRLRSVMNDIEVNAEQYSIDTFVDERKLDVLSIKEAIYFIDEVFEIAFGDNAVNKDYSVEEVLDQIKEFSDKSLYVDQCVLEENDHAYDRYIFWLENEK